VTGIGSLPFADPAEAIRFVAATTPEIPYWPQLPAGSRGSGMADQLIDAPGFQAFESAMDFGLFPRAIAVKGQVVGPVTLTSHTPRDAGAERALEEPARLAAAGAAWQIERLSRFGLPVILFVDEPSLGSLPAGELAAGGRCETAVASVLSVIRKGGALAGLHCCAPLPPSFVRRVDPDIYSFDASDGAPAFFDSSDGQAFVASGGLLALGLVRTSGAPDARSPETIVNVWRLAAGPFSSLVEVARQSFVTPACGLGTLAPPLATEIFERARRISERLSEIAAQSRSR